MGKFNKFRSEIWVSFTHRETHPVGGNLPPGLCLGAGP